MPEESHGYARALLENVFKKKSKDNKNLVSKEFLQKNDNDNVVHDLERSLTKDDPLLESNTYNGDQSEKSESKKWTQDEVQSTSDNEDKENKSSLRTQSILSSNSRQRRRNRKQKVKWSTALTSSQANTEFCQQNNVKYLSSGCMLPSGTPTSEVGEDSKTSDYAYSSVAISDKENIETSTDFNASNADSMNIGTEDSVASSPSTFTRIISKLWKEEDVNTESRSDVSARGSALDATNTLQTLWKASSELIRKIRDEQNSSADLNVSKEVIKPSEENSQKQPIWKKFKFPGFNKSKEADLEANRSKTPENVTSIPMEEIKTENTVTEDKVEEKNGEEDIENQNVPSTSVDAREREDEEEGQDPDLPTPVPRPRKQNVSSATVVEERETNDPKPATRRRRKKRVPRKPKHDTATAPDEIIEEETTLNDTIPELRPSTPQTPPPPDTLDDGMVLGVTCHHSDHLRADLRYMSHPVVRVSLADGATGKYLQKSSSSRRVTSYYENDNVKTVLPIMTQPYDFRANHSVLPRWEETLIFNESFQSLVASRNIQVPSTSAVDVDQQTVQIDTGIKAPSPIVFFVIRDFVSMAKANNLRKGKDDMDKGWHNIAWAFLKLVGSNGESNTGKRIRLQLFHTPRNLATSSSETTGQEQAFAWWRDHPRHPYPSTLYVTLKAVNRPDDMNPASRSMFATQPECGVQSYNQLQSSLEFADNTHAQNEVETPKWSRLPGQSCKIPNSSVLRLWSGSEGAYTIKFSTAGTRIAVACKHGATFPILIYGILNGSELGALNNHQQLVYDIQWSNDDSKIVSASADGTAQVWDLKDKSKPQHTLPHPAYVYTANFHPTAQHIVATGGYDAVIRVWNIAASPAKLLQELEGHKTFINTLAFDVTGLTLYSGDSCGTVIAWNCHAHEKAKKNAHTTWTLKTKYEEREMVGVCINSIEIHPRNNKLLLHCRDSIIRMLDVRIHTLLHYTGSVSSRQMVRSALTPCGSLVIGGSEDGCAYVWNADSGDQVAIYNELGYSKSVRDVSYHPHDHIVAFCCFSPSMPVLVFKYDKTVAAIGAGIIQVVESGSKRNDDPNDEDVIVDNTLNNTHASSLKVDRVKRHLDSVLPAVELQQSKWSIARNMLPVTMATKAFADGKNKGNSSLRPISPAYAGNQNLSPRGYTQYDAYGSYGPNNTLSTWGSTFDTTQTSNPVIEPSYLSPHASPEARAIANHIAANQPRPNSSENWRPTFTAVGGNPYKGNSLNSSLGPEVLMAVDKDGKKSLQFSNTPNTKSQQKVVALYDYQSKRSDELSLLKGDLIKLLYKDGDLWWFGERLHDEKQGYFPSNYVQAEDENEETLASNEELLINSVKKEPEIQPVNAKVVHALKMPSGKVQFYSQSESDGDEEKHKVNRSFSSRQRRREQRPSKSQHAPQHTPSTSSPARDTAPPSTSRDPSAAKPPQTASPARLPSPRKLPTPSFPSPSGEITETRKWRKKPKSPTSEHEISVNENTLTEKSDFETAVRKSRPIDDLRTPRPDDVTELGTTIVASQPGVEEDTEPQRIRFGILKDVQAKLAENEASFSRSMVGGHGFGGTGATTRATSLAPILTSTASKPRKKPRKKSSRKTKPTVVVTEPSHDDDDGDDVEMMTYLRGSPSGLKNPAFDESSEV